MAYVLIMTAVTMFAFQFLFNQKYEKLCGNTFRASAVFSLGTNITGFIILFVLNKFRFEFTWFSLFIALAAAINNLLYSYCSIKALGKINLSLYSVFAMLGGMALPFIAGIAFFDEKLTLAKIICFATITCSLFLTVERGQKKSGWLFYVGIFILNGMSGVYAKCFKSAPFATTSDRGYSMLIALSAITISASILIFDRSKRISINKKSIGCMSVYGILCNIANYFLLISLNNVPASAQYPMVTGGVMIISTVICFFTDTKPSKKDIAAVGLSFAGIMALTFIQI